MAELEGSLRSRPDFQRRDSVQQMIDLHGALGKPQGSVHFSPHNLSGGNSSQLSLRHGSATGLHVNWKTQPDMYQTNPGHIRSVMNRNSDALLKVGNKQSLMTVTSSEINLTKLHCLQDKIGSLTKVTSSLEIPKGKTPSASSMSNARSVDSRSRFEKLSNKSAMAIHEGLNGPSLPAAAQPPRKLHRPSKVKVNTRMTPL